MLSFLFTDNPVNTVFIVFLKETRIIPKVSILGVVALWGQCRDIPTDKGQVISECLKFSKKPTEKFDEFLP